MNSFPSISEYKASLERPKDLFRTIEIEEVRRDIYGEIELRSGNSAAVFRVRTADSGGKEMNLRCFRKWNPHLPKVYGYLSQSRCRLIAPCRYCEKEMCVVSAAGSRCRYYDVALSQWIEGATLETLMRQAAKRRDGDALRLLARTFDRMCAELLRQPFAHGDLKPENIIITPDEEARLIDYDAAFVPGSGFDTTSEIGTPAFQHPGRDSSMYDKHIDDYPMLLISANLHLAALRPEILDNSDDNLPLCPQEIFSGDRTMLETALGLFAGEGDARTYQCCRLLLSPTPRIDRIGELFDLPERCDTPLVPFERGGRWGFADTEGRQVIAPWWDEAFDFHEGLAAVRLGDRYHYIDTCGRTVINGSGWQCVKSFSEGYAAVCADGKWGYIDRNGRCVTPLCYDRARNVRNGLAEVACGGKWSNYRFF